MLEISITGMGTKKEVIQALEELTEEIKLLTEDQIKEGGESENETLFLTYNEYTRNQEFI